MYMNEKERILIFGYDALDSLKMAEYELGKACGWGLTDISDGSLLYGLMEQAELEGTKRYIESARVSVERMGDALRSSEIESFYTDSYDILGFFDIFYDSFITDFLMSVRMNEARDRVNEAIYDLSDVIRRIRFNY